MSTYKVHFTWKDKARTIKARSLDMTHPYFVSITGLIFQPQSAVIIDPDGDELRREFGEADHLMLPFQSVQLIEEYQEKPKAAERKGGKVIPFGGSGGSGDSNDGDNRGGSGGSGGSGDGNDGDIRGGSGGVNKEQDDE